MLSGMREPENISALAALNIDIMAFSFKKDDPRLIKMISSRAGIIPDFSEDRLKKAGQDIDGITPQKADITKVGIFADDMPQNIVTRIYNYDLNAVWLDGSENSVMIDNLRRTVVPDIKPQLTVIKAITIANDHDLCQCSQYEGHADILLLKNKPGEEIAWSVLDNYQGATPFIIGGDITPAYAPRIKAVTNPLCQAICLGTHFETEPGTISPEAVARFLKALK